MYAAYIYEDGTVSKPELVKGIVRPEEIIGHDLIEYENDKDFYVVNHNMILSSGVDSKGNWNRTTEQITLIKKSEYETMLTGCLINRILALENKVAELEHELSVTESRINR